MSSRDAAAAAAVNRPGPYGYVPTEYVCIIFIVLFGVSGLLHVGQAIKSKLWWMIFSMGLGCLGEVIGWSGRLWSSKEPRLLDPFLMNTVATIISPSFMSAANFAILGLIISRLGFQYSRLTPRWYLVVFITFDVAALVVQAIGGARASTAAKNNEDADPGGRIMLYGIIVQMIALSVYVILGAEFVARYFADRPVRKVQDSVGSMDEEKNEKLAHGRPLLDRGTNIMLIGLVINVTFFFVRTIYRTIELNNGWSGSIITNQLLFNILDGTPIVLCTYTFNVIHPGYYLRSKALTTSQA